MEDRNKKKTNTLRISLTLAATAALGATACVAISPHQTHDLEIPASQSEQEAYGEETPASQDTENEADAGPRDDNPDHPGVFQPAAEAPEASPSSANRPTAQNPPSNPAPEKKPIWIVDSPAHAETIHHDAEGYWTPQTYYTMCTACGAEIAGAPSSHGESIHPGQPMGWTYASRGGDWIETSPAWDEIISIPESGHWE